MTDGDALLRASIAAPADEALRLVYADWLEEHGDPRGEFIRLQAEMDRLPAYSDGYVERKRRREELRARIAPGWIEAMGYRRQHSPLFAALPPGRRERWRLAEEFIDVWHGPLRPGDGFAEGELAEAEGRLGCRLPAALREWYALAGKRESLWSRQDRLLTLSGLRREASGDLIFRYENQGCERWGIRAEDLGRDDPPVWQFGERGVSSPTTTAFALLVLVYETQFAPGVIPMGENVGSVQVDPRWSRCDLPERYWVVSPLHIYEATDLIVQTQMDQWVYVTARDEAALGQLSPDLLGALERYR